MSFRISLVDFAVLTVVVMWGISFTAVKVALAEIHPLAFIMGRSWVIGTIAIIALLIWSRPLRLKKRAWGRLILLGILGQAGYQFFFATGLEQTSTFHAAVIISATPIFIALGTVIGRIEKVSRLQWFGLFLSFVGLALFLRNSTQDPAGEATLRGDLLCLGSTICWALYTVISKPLLKRETPLQITSFAVLTSIPFVLLYGWHPYTQQDWNISLEAWLAFFYAAIFPIYIAYLLWMWGVDRLGPVRTSIYSYLVPIVTAAVSWLWIQETITLIQALLALLVIAGMMITRLSSLATLKKWAKP